MSIKWNKKMAIKAITTLTSPFEKFKQNGQGKGIMGGMAEEIKKLAERNRGITPK